MKARLVPVYFDPDKDNEFDKQVDRLKGLLFEEAEILSPVALGALLPDADAAIFPQLLGEAYRQVGKFKKIDLPILIITSEFGTVSMWDWEIISYLKAKGVETIAPYSLEQTKKVCKGLGVKRELKQTKFLVFQDNPGEGFQADIFKRFYWWEDECARCMLDRFGVTIIKRSFKEMGARARQISDQEAEAVWKEWKSELNVDERLSRKAIYSALKVYIAVKQELERDRSIKGVGINCLNESHFSDTTPCLAWCILYEEDGLIWGCEADTVSMLTEYILNKSLDTSVMMTNLYPFLMGQAALKHEKIEKFPDIDGDPRNYILAAHCGYLGILPRPFSTEWTLRPKVLAIVDKNASAVDARLPVGKITLAKFHSTFDKMTVVEGNLRGYVQYPGSDCLNGAVIEVPNGRRLIDKLSSHHYILIPGYNLSDIEILSKILGFKVEEL